MQKINYFRVWADSPSPAPQWYLSISISIHSLPYFPFHAENLSIPTQHKSNFGFFNLEQMLLEPFSGQCSDKFCLCALNLNVAELKAKYKIQNVAFLGGGVFLNF